MATLVSGTLGDLATVVAGSAVDVSHLEDVVVTVLGSGLDGTAAMSIEYSQDGVRWAATPTSSAFTYAAPSGCYALTGCVRLIRANVSAISSGTFYVRYAGRSTDDLPARFGTLGDLASQAAGTAYDVSDLEKVIVTVTSNPGAVVAIQASYNGTDWLTVGSFTNTAGSVLVPFPCMSIRANATSWSSGTAYVRFGGHTCAGKQRFGTLGDFTTTTTGTAVDVQDLNSVSLRAVFSDSGTFANSQTVVIEQSSDGTRWTLAAGSSTLTSSGNLTITAPMRLLRARCSVHSIGSCAVRFGGVNSDLSPNA